MRNPVSHFSYSQADLDVKRSKFDRSQDHLTTMTAGYLYPLMVDEVYPGDTFSVDMASLVRMSTPIHPVMGNAYLDLYYFFVPNRIIWDHWKEFMGESPEDPYINPISYSVPQLIPNSSGVVDSAIDYGVVPPKSILDYLGIPAQSVPDTISALPVRAFCKIWNEWFRDQNLQNAIDLDTGDANIPYSVVELTTDKPTYWGGTLNSSGADPEAYVTNAAHGGDLPPVNKYHDYFTSALKEPQKGDPVPIPLSGFAPVYATSNIKLSDLIFNDPELSININDTPIKMVTSYGDIKSGTIVSDGGDLNFFDYPSEGSSFDYAHFDNLGADLSRLQGVYSTINDLRYAFQLQRYLERENTGGSRYREILKAHFGVTSPDATQQVPEFLGGKRISINMSQVLQTSATDDVSPQGNTAAYSLTSDRMSAFTKSFTEHGWLMCVGCIRTEHTYQQGIERMFSRKDKFDFYFPEFANISEQPIYNREIYLPSEANNIPFLDSTAYWEKFREIFGYQEAWAELRYKPNRISGEFRSSYAQSLDIWHYGDDYQSQPYLNSEWIRETRRNIDRTLAYSSSGTEQHDQFICDFYFKLGTTRILPTYSIPGLADHH